MFYHIWIRNPHYAHVVEPLYSLLKKGRNFKWELVHIEAVKRLKGLLVATPALRKDIYKEGQTRLSTEDKGTPTLNAFNENEYDGEWLLIDRFLRTMTADASWTK